MQKVHLPGKTTIVLVVLVLMTVTVVVLRIKLAVTGTAKAPDPQQTLNYLLNQAVPSQEDLEKLFLQSLGKDSLRSSEERLLAADSSVVIGHVSKPEGSGPFSSVVIFHDLPSSVKTTKTVSNTLGEDISNVQQSVVSVIDYRDFREPSDVLPDAATALQYHQKFRETVKGPVFLVGIGGGALPVLAAATDKNLGSDIAGIILVNGYHSPKRVWEQLEVKNPLEARFYQQYFDCDSGLNSETTESLSDQNRERITRCLEEYEVTGSIKNIPILLIRTQSHETVTDEVYQSFKALLGEADVSESTIETADTTGNIFVNATSPEFLQARSLISEWMKTVSVATADASSQTSQTTKTETNTNTNAATTTNVDANTAAPIIVQ